MKREIIVGEHTPLTLDQFGRQPWRRQSPDEAADLLLRALDAVSARKMSRHALFEARRARSRRHYAFWAQVGVALASSEYPARPRLDMKRSAD